MAALIFDLDGTLVDSAADIHGALNGALAVYGVSVTPRQTRSFVGRGAPTLIARAHAATGLPEDERDALLADFLGRYQTAVSGSRMYPRVIDALDQLTGAGHRLGLCTNKPIAPTRTVLNHFDLARRMDAVIGGDSLAVAKPDPAPLRAVMTEMQTDTCLFIGDSETDCETARNTGVPFILHTRGYRNVEPDALPHAAAFDDWAALPDIVDALLRSA